MVTWLGGRVAGRKGGKGARWYGGRMGGLGDGEVVVAGRVAVWRKLNKLNCEA